MNKRVVQKAAYSSMTMIEYVGAYICTHTTTLPYLVDAALALKYHHTMNLTLSMSEMYTARLAHLLMHISKAAVAPARRTTTRSNVISGTATITPSTGEEGDPTVPVGLGTISDVKPIEMDPAQKLIRKWN